MIDKAVLDALAEVIKLERAKFQEKLDKLTTELVETAGVSEVEGLRLITGLEERFETLIKHFNLSQLEQARAANDDKTEIKDIIDNAFEVNADLIASFKADVKASIAQVRVDVEAHGTGLTALVTGAVKQHLEGIYERLSENVSKLIGKVENGEQGETGLTGEKGDQGERGEQGPAGIEGGQGVQGEVGEPGAQGDTGAAGTPGEKGEAGERGADGEVGERGETGEPGRTGDAGIDGKGGDCGPAGADAVDGADGVDGRDGVDKYILSPRKAAADEKLDKNEIVYCNGGIYQSIRKTTGDPENDPGSYHLIVAGVADIGYSYDDVDRSTTMHIRLSDGTVFENNFDDGARLFSETPEHPIDGDAVFNGTEYRQYVNKLWHSTSVKGDTGAPGIRGRKGLKGDQGVGVEDLLFQDNHVIVTLTNGEARSIPIPEMVAPEVVKTHGVHVKAPKNPPPDYLWVSKTGVAKIWDGAHWINLK